MPTGLCFKVPFMRHVYTWMTAASVDKKDIIKSINNGNSPVIVPGGVQEVIYLAQYYHKDLLTQDPSSNNTTSSSAPCTKTCTLYLKRRAGFVKLALKHGLPLVPVFSFGLRELFDFYIPDIPWLHKLG
ncbi:hypothetical protein EON63_20150 [archaeon]|nr:MAG: hypothetical protein EON63_20150 [archaeon]